MYTHSRGAACEPLRLITSQHQHRSDTATQRSPITLHAPELVSVELEVALLVAVLDSELVDDPVLVDVLVSEDVLVSVDVAVADDVAGNTHTQQGRRL